MSIDVSDIRSPVLRLVEPPPPEEQTELDIRQDRCRHIHIRLVAKTRSATCSQCGKEIDAFDVLLEYAPGERRWQHWHTLANAAQKTLERLRAEERKTKARLKNASRKEATVAVAEEQARTERERFAIAEAARDIGEKCRRIERLTRRRST
jgi:hypothetical protein